MNVKYAVIFEQAPANWAAYETLRQFGDPLPVPSSLAGEVEITSAA